MENYYFQDIFAIYRRALGQCIDTLNSKDVQFLRQQMIFAIASVCRAPKRTALLTARVNRLADSALATIYVTKYGTPYTFMRGI